MNPIGIAEVSATWMWYKECRRRWEIFPKSEAITKMVRQAYGQWLGTNILYWHGGK